LPAHYFQTTPKKEIFYPDLTQITGNGHLALSCSPLWLAALSKTSWREANMKNKFSNEQILAICERDGISRKTAIRKLGKMSVKDIAALTVPKAALVTDVKSRAANDDTNQPVAAAAAAPAPEKAPKKAAAPKPVVPPTAAGSARAEGIRLYKLSNVAVIAKDEGVKTDVLFKHVYGPMGAKWTWEQRAKAVGLATAEEAAREFARMRGGKPQEFVKAEEPKEKK
jgi:hypothetical protein